MQSPVGSLIFLALLIGVFYFMLIRPQKRRVEQHRQIVESLGNGDEVVTIGGIFGTIQQIGSEDVEIEVAPGTTIRLLKSAIARKLTDEDEEEEEEDYDEEDEDDEEVDGGPELEESLEEIDETAAKEERRS
jgi:preprotein translocase subunit YajC